MAVRGKEYYYFYRPKITLTGAAIVIFCFAVAGYIIYPIRRNAVHAIIILNITLQQ